MLCYAMAVAVAAIAVRCHVAPFAGQGLTPTEGYLPLAFQSLHQRQPLPTLATKLPRSIAIEEMSLFTTLWPLRVELEDLLKGAYSIFFEPAGGTARATVKMLRLWLWLWLWLWHWLW